jgi:CRP/FNR family transcriptional regulator, cyclic AMP receptor protein
MDFASLRTTPFLKNLTDTEFDAFTCLCKVHDLQPGERVIEQGKLVRSLFIVAKGTVHARARAQDREILLGRIEAGGFFGEINLFDPDVATASIYAMDRVSLAEIDYDVLHDFMEEHSAIGYKIVSSLMQGVCKRLRATDHKLVASMFWSHQGAQPA